MRLGARDPSPPEGDRDRHDPPRRPMHDTEIREEVVIDAARGGDLLAWEHIIRQHQEVIFRSAWLATRDPASAEDTTQAAFVRAYRSLGSLESGAALRPWLVGITATAARRHLREMALRRDAKIADPHPCPRLPATPVHLGPGVPWPTPLEHEALVDAFDGLVDEDRLILAARYSFGLSQADAATRLGIQPDQVGDRLRASVRRLRGRVADPAAAGSRAANARSGAESAPRVDRLISLRDDQLGSMTMAAVMSQLPWTPDVAPVISARLAREVVAYPEHFASRAPAVKGGVDPVAVPRGTSTVAAMRAKRMGRTATRGSTVVSMKAAVLVVMVAVVGISVAASTPGWDIPTEVRARVGELLGQPGSVPAEQDGSGSSTAPQPGVALTAQAPELSTASAPELSIVGARTLGDGEIGASVRVDWSPIDGFGPAVRSRLERSIDGGAWRLVASIEAEAPMLAAIGPGRRYVFRVRSFDVVGAEAVSSPIGIELAVRDPRSTRLALAADDWITRRGNVIKRRLIAMAPDASLGTEFTGSSVAVVGPAGPSRGVIGVRIDGGAWSRDDLRTWVDSARMVVFSRDLEHGRHSLDVRAESDGVAVDAVLIVRTTGT